MNAQGFGNDIKDVHARVECAERVLKHHLDVAPRFARPGFAVDFQTTFRVDKVHHGFCQRGFAAAAFADDAQRFARFQIEGNRLQQGFAAFFKPARRFFDGNGKLLRLQDGGGLVRQRYDFARGTGVQQHLRVFVLRTCEHFRRCARFDNASTAHHGDVVCKAADKVQVVGDVEHGHVVRLLQTRQQIENLRLHGDIQGGGRFVGNQELGFDGNRHRNHRPLPLSAGKLEGIGKGFLLRLADAGFRQEFDRPRPCLFFV